ncbi:MAG TPA: hypothetical protein VFN13_06100 [Rudaea sp.]|nr:hypothetical protein [Rudaea sp.]
MVDRNGDAVIHVNGNLIFAPMSDRTPPVNTSLTGVPGVWHDDDSNPNVVSVSGEHFSAVVHDRSLGANIDITPETDFAGISPVTVRETDKDHPSDTVSTPSTLNVVRVEKIFVDGFKSN